MHLADALDDVDRRVTHALHVRVDLDHREDEAQVDRHGLLHGQQIQRELVDLALVPVDGGFRLLHLRGQAKVARAVGFHGAVDGLLGHAGHDQDFFFQVAEALVKPHAHDASCPCS